jgi:hypothetical protein
MPKKPAATVPLTGGAWFDFEDKVAALFMAYLLSGRPPLGAEFGRVSCIDFQVRESGWWLDDLLITGQNAEFFSRALISIKRDRQVTNNRFPSEFTEAIWKQWLATEGNPLDREFDLLCLATGQIPDTALSAWESLLEQALCTDPGRLHQRLTGSQCSQAQYSLYRSPHCPATISLESSIEEYETLKLLRRVGLLYFDFRSQQSKDKALGFDLCRSVLDNGHTEEAIELWRDLVSISAELRPRGGTVDLSILIHKLKKYSFKDYPTSHARKSDLLVFVCMEGPPELGGCIREGRG